MEARAKTFSFFGVSPRPKDERADQVQVPNWRDTPWTSLDLGEEKHRPVDNASNLHPMDRYSALPGPPATVIQVSGSPSSRHRGEDDVSTREILLLCTPTLFLSLSISLSLFLSCTIPFKIQVLHTINTIQTYTHIFKHMCSHLCVIMIINPVIIVCRMLSLPCCHTSH